jgi:AcrR family transcriptional regulator
MPRPELHSTDHILDAARTLVLERGARAATVNSIATASGAPKGSIYHRFTTTGDLLATMWLRAVRRAQAGVLDAVKIDDPVEAALAGGLSVYDFACAEPADARLLASLRREDLVASVSDRMLRRELSAANNTLQTALVELTLRLYGRASRAAVEQTACAVTDLPLGAIRRHLVTGSALPVGLRDQLEAAIRAALAVGRGNRRS